MLLVTKVRAQFQSQSCPCFYFSHKGFEHFWLPGRPLQLGVTGGVLPDPHRGSEEAGLSWQGQRGAKQQVWPRGGVGSADGPSPGRCPCPPCPPVLFAS